MKLGFDDRFGFGDEIGRELKRRGRTPEIGVGLALAVTVELAVGHRGRRHGLGVRLAVGMGAIRARLRVIDGR
jgi:hypothetical protein